MNLLLLSNSTAPGLGPLVHALDAVAELFGDRREIVFVPYALADHDAYTAAVAAALEPLGVVVVGAHDGDPSARLSGAAAIYVGGGNTFRLLHTLQRLDLLDVVRAAVAAGTPYLGSSAGTNLACPSIRTTNDMPIVQPTSFSALGLVPFGDQSALSRRPAGVDASGRDARGADHAVPRGEPRSGARPA